MDVQRAEVLPAGVLTPGVLNEDRGADTKLLTNER
jgi:hypothetical protein